MAFIGLSWTEATKEENCSTIAMENRCASTLEVLLGAYFRTGLRVERIRGGESRTETASSSLEASEN